MVGSVRKSSLGVLEGLDPLQGPVFFPFQCLVLGPHQVSCMGYKLILEINHPQELLKRLGGERVRENRNCLLFGGERNGPLGRNIVAQEINGRQAKLTFGQVDNQSISSSRSSS